MKKFTHDRKGRTLSHENNLHYQKIIVALSETARLMKAVDGVLGRNLSRKMKLRKKKKPKYILVKRKFFSTGTYDSI